MKTKHILIAAVAALAIGGTATLMPEDLSSATTSLLDSTKKKYKLVWEENFDSPTLDTSKWSKRQRTTANWAKHMTDLDELFEIKDSRLRLYCKRNNGIAKNDTAKYLTAGVTTYNKMTFTYGKVEVRARVKAAKGCQPAIWLAGNSRRQYGTPGYVELDIMEHVGHNQFVYQTAHNYYIDILNNRKDPPYQTKAAVNPEEYNVYAVEVLPKKVIFSVNGQTTMTYPRIKKHGQGQFPYGTDDLFIIINTNAGSTWAGHADPSQLPAYIDIDWVKVYSI